MILALSGIIVTYDGWYSALYFTEEIRDPVRDLPRSMVGGVALVIVIYMLVNLAVWSTVTSGSAARVAGVGEFFSRILGFVILSPIILLFYIPPRLLFLVEDYKYRATWVSMTIAVAPVAYRFIIGSPLKTDW